MPQVAVAWICRPAGVISQVPRWHHTKGANRRQLAALRATQRVFAVAKIEHDLSFAAVRKFDCAGEDVARIAVRWIVTTFRPTRIASDLFAARTGAAA